MSVDFKELGEQFSNLDPENIGNWPILVRGLIILFVCAAILFAGYWFDTQHQQKELTQVEAEESGLIQTFETKQSRAVNLDAYKAQMAEMKESFGTMLRQLPSKNEVPDLLEDITQKGLATGLEFKLFKPNKESPQEFYAILPITLDVTGSYNSLGEFVSGVAALPRIVTIHDIEMSVSDKESGRLSMKATAKTYRYLDSEELAAGGRNKGARGKRAARRR